MTWSPDCAYSYVMKNAPALTRYFLLNEYELGKDNVGYHQPVGNEAAVTLAIPW